MLNGLLRFSPTLEPLPELAKCWTISLDGLEYVFNLEQNVRFHDGRPMTADDVLFSIMRFHTELAPRARAIFALVDKAEAPDAHTVKLTLKRVFQPFLLMFDVTACTIVPKHLFDGQDFRTAPAVQRPIGTGPFRFTEWQRGNFIRMDRFEGYWKPNQRYIDTIIWRIVPDSQSRQVALESGAVQFTTSGDIEPFAVPGLRARPNIEVRTDGWRIFAP